MVLMLAVIAIFVPISVKGMYRAVLDNAQLAGVEIAKRFAANEINYISEQEFVLNTLENGLRPENRAADVEEWLRTTLTYMFDQEVLSGVEGYASIGGRIVAATYWEGDASFDVQQAQWYQNALAANGEISYTDAYEDVRLKKKVVTLSKQIRGTQDVVALDLYPEELLEIRTMDDLPEDSNYYLCDSSGTLLYYMAGEQKKNVIQERFGTIFGEIQEGIHDDYDSYTMGTDGRKRGVYYYRLDNGWYSVITIPFDVLLHSSNAIWGPFIFAGAIFVAVLLIFMAMDIFNSKKSALYNEIVGVLGNSYYALYLIDLSRGEYSMLKGSDYIRRKLPAKGDYQALLETMGEVIEKDTYQEMKQVFSIENMRQLMKSRVRDFGGDFKRIFNNEYRWVHMQMLYDESMQKDKVVLCFRDVQEEKKYELGRMQLLQDSLKNMQSMAQSKNKFFSSMSHDMRTPLNGIIGLSALALKTPDDTGKMKNALEKIQSSGKQLLGFINDILEISKIEQGKLEIQISDFPLKERLRELSEIYALQADSGKKKYSCDLRIEDECVAGDWRRIQQILDNLLSNALKYSPEGASIAFTASESRDLNSRYRKYSFTVSDTGYGMSEEFQKKLFLPFERETTFGAANVSGTGLGMSIVYDLVTQMEGTIEFVSKLGEGTTFKVMIPLLVSETEVSAASENTSGESLKEEEILKGKRVLLAEDNEINMEIAVELLTMYGMEVSQAWNGKQAVDAFAAAPCGSFDLILLDMQMPEMDGCEAARTIRAMERPDAEGIPIVAITANAFSEDVAATEKAGMNAHISKPIDIEILKKTLAELLKGGMQEKKEKDV